MTSPQFSVIIPVYNHAAFLAETLQSVLAQTYRDFEIVIVNDGSTDDPGAVVKQFHDARIKFIEQENRGATAARNTGMRAARGEAIAFLDADDRWHPEKLEQHAAFLARHSEIGASYNARFELNYSAETVRELWRPPRSVTLSDLVLGFPFAPSDLIVRREWAFRVDLFDERYRFYGDDLDFFCRLALAGCAFAGINRALNYRKYHSKRVIHKLAECVRFALEPLERTFADPRCPGETRAVRARAFANHSLAWAFAAFLQNETSLGQDLVRRAARWNPNLLVGEPCDLINELVWHSVADASADHAQILRQVVDQLPGEMAGVAAQFEWAVARGYLIKGMRAMIWDRVQAGRADFEQARARGARLDAEFAHLLGFRLASYEMEFGAAATQTVLGNLEPALKRIGGWWWMRKFKGFFLIDGAFEKYRIGEYARVPRRVVAAIASDPRYLMNRGVLAIFLRALIASR
ncbi:MAG: glycosyltransferase family 2 protein [Chloroflexi bacterium]|nr:glycosyltransferase family 2 protein [Chloroflexota bacterium]